MNAGPQAELYQAHHNLRELLDILERQCLSLGAGGEPDLEVMAELLEYLNDHPEQHHNDYEARLWRRLTWRAPDYDRLSAELAAQQEQVLAEGRRLQRLVEGILENQVVSRGDAATTGQRYVGAYRSLIAHEENEGLPALAAHLRASDWVELTTERHWCWGVGQPMTLPYETQYDSLCRSIVLRANQVWPPAAASHVRCPVCDRG